MAGLTITVSYNTGKSYTARIDANDFGYAIQADRSAASTSQDLFNGVFLLVPCRRQRCPACDGE